MTGKVAIVSAANDEYFYLLDGLIASLEDAKLAGEFDFCAYDVGLTAEQVRNLESRNVRVVVPQWTIEFPNQGQAPRWLRAMTNRPCLPRHFPGYDMYVWIDADAWIQQPEGIYAAMERARNGAIAIVAERFGQTIEYPQLTPNGYIMVEVNEAAVRKNLAICYRDCFGEETERFAEKEILNTGFFALRGDSPIWEQWLQCIRQGLKQAPHKMVEQQALNLYFHEGKIPVEVMTNRFNWNISLIEPVMDVKSGYLVDPEERKPLGLVHLTDLKGVQFLEIPDLDGQFVNVHLHYRDFHAHPVHSDGA